jgi:release factor glutamine methyltransferase
MNRSELREDLLALGVRMLTQAAVASPQEDAETLMAHAAATNQPALGLLERRAGREPLAYIVGRCRFCGLELMVDDRVLVPTEERTGTLVHAALDLGHGARVHEVGTGCGAVALAIKSKRPDLVVTASDISPEAVDVAKENARGLDLDVAFCRADGLPAGRYDLVVANLPYTDTGQRTQTLLPEQANFQPGVALWAGRDSLGIIRRLIDRAPSGIVLALEHAPHHTDEVHRLLDDCRTLRDACGDERVTIGRVR